MKKRLFLVILIGVILTGGFFFWQGIIQKKIIKVQLINFGEEIRKEIASYQFLGSENRIYLTTGNDLVAESPQTMIIFSSTRTLKSQIDLLQKLQKSSTIKNIKKIDLRFKHVVISFKE